jgi:hypothetical protein
MSDLFLITGLFGDALKSLEADGIAVDDRSARLILDRFCDLYKAQASGSGAAGRSGRRASEPRGLSNPAKATRGKQAARSAGRG